MRTYSKRQKRSRINNDEDQWVPVPEVDGHKGSQKRSAVLDAEGHSNKRQKTQIQKSAMVLTSSPFETPYPTLEAQNQAYKLPSSKPQSALTPFSPVPKQAASQSKTGKLRGPRTSTRNGKENSGRYNVQRSSSKTLGSLTLGSEADVRLESAADDDLSRTFSHSSSSASSRASSPRSANRGGRKSQSAPKSKQSSRTKKTLSQPTNKSSRGDSLALASPFTSRASSPVDQQNDAHIVDQTAVSCPRKYDMGPPPLPAAATIKTRRIGPSDKHFDPNAPSRPLRPSLPARAMTALSVSTQNSSERPIHDQDQRKTKSKDKKILRELQRRPSAPSSLQRFAKVVSKPFVASKLTTKMSPSKVNNARDQGALAPALDPALPPTAEVRKPPTISQLDDTHFPLAWMNSRSGIDFNRPPSSMSVVFGFGRDGVDINEDDAVFTSSEEDFTDEEYEGIPKKSTSDQGPFGGFDLGMKGEDFADGVPFASTPLNKGIEGKLLGAFTENTGENQDVQDDDAEDMELTAALEGVIEQHLDSQDRTPWITDSIISIPTAYLQRRKQSNEGPTAFGNSNQKEDLDDNSKTLDSLPYESPRRLSSPFRLSDIDSSSSADNTFGLNESPAREAKNVVDELPNVQTNAKTLGAQRTRSGTIVAPKPMAARRTRTGTIVGPAPQLSSSQAQMQQCGTLASARRTRSGTIVGPLAPPSAGKARSGSIMRVASLPVPVKGGHGLTGPNDGDEEFGCLDGSGGVSEGASTAFGTQILEEVDEFEAYADNHYTPCPSSSPDPIDFLRLARMMKEEQDPALSDRLTATLGGTAFGDTQEMVWCVADHPPSPGFANQNGRRALIGGVGRSGKFGKAGRGFKAKRTKNQLRFETPGGCVDELDSLEVENHQDIDVSDDELNTIG